MGFISVAQSRGKMGTSSAFNTPTQCLGLVFKSSKFYVDFVKFKVLNDPWTI